MSSILAPKWAKRAQMGGGGVRGGELRDLSQWVQLYTGAQVNFGALAPDLTYENNGYVIVKWNINGSAGKYGGVWCGGEALIRWPHPLYTAGFRTNILDDVNSFLHLQYLPH